MGVEVRPVADYTDVAAMARALQGSLAVVHLAARAHVLGAEPPQEALLAFERANVDAALACAEAALQAGCRRFVLVSSIGVNGQATQGQHFTEDDEPSPQEPYACTKWQAESAVAERLVGTKMELVVVRPPLVYGPGCPGNFRALLGLVSRLPVLPFGALRARRSYIGIDNLCSALETATLHPSCAGRRFLLSDGEDIDFASLIRLLANGMGRAHIPQWAVPPILLQSLATLAGRRDTFAKLCGELRVDSRAFRQCTGWEPPVALSHGLMKTAAAHREAALFKLL
ncbi:NAD-dependent epimerase [Fluviibacter phosphoraccumulans]|uniref:NAD-dependent epimerase n=2 Tax=Fluviibacter phosphoraccumulans TaxID=1751046 RepID=A0A7R6TN11_9RHOO|nr:NAD-dependent epimerase [Fluviibacter phosphoraccumulans]BBU70456.1 NAD-dependent epimerase [Fluviibacter phosphoraccumulans]